MSNLTNAPIVHAHFEGGVALWQLRRGEEVEHHGALPSETRDPLAELCALECRLGATCVRLPAAGLTPAEIAYAQSRNWELVT